MIDAQIQHGQQWLEELLTILQVPAPVQVQEVAQEGSTLVNYWLTIDHGGLTPEQIDLLLGEKGHTIDAIQYLTNTIVNLGVEREHQHPFTVELNGYRLARQQALQQVVLEVAQRVKTTGEEEAIAHLSAAERRQVHGLFEAFPELTTESRGQEPDRHLVVRLQTADSPAQPLLSLD